MAFDFTPGGLFAGLVVSSVGFGFYLFGKRQMRLPQMIVGGSMMIFPTFVPTAPLCLGIAATLAGCLWLALRAGR